MEQKKIKLRNRILFRALEEEITVEEFNNVMIFLEQEVKENASKYNRNPDWKIK